MELSPCALIPSKRLLLLLAALTLALFGGALAGAQDTPTPSPTPIAEMSNLQLSDIAFNSVVVTWDDSGSAASAYGVRAYARGRYSPAKTVTSPTVTLYQLAPNTTYTLTVKKLPSEEVLTGSFTTPRPPAISASLVVSDIRHKSARVSWKAVVEELQDKVGLVRLRTITGKSTDGEHHIDQFNFLSSTAHTIRGLRVDAEYQITIRLTVDPPLRAGEKKRTTAGEFVMIFKTTFRTGPPPPGFTPTVTNTPRPTNTPGPSPTRQPLTNLRFTGITNYSVTIHWDDFQPGTQHYVITLSDDGRSFNMHRSGSSHSFWLGGLRADHEYTVKVFRQNRGGGSDVLTGAFRTLPTPPPTNTPTPLPPDHYHLKNLQLSHITRTSARVSWQDPHPLDSRYRIILNPGGRTVRVYRPTTQHVFRNLQAGTEYEVVVQKFQRSLPYHLLSAKFQTVSDPVPTPPDLGLIVSDQTLNSITVQWSDPPGVSIFIITLTGNRDFKSLSKRSNGNEYTFSGLPANASFTVELKALGNGDTVLSSATVAAQTLSTGGLRQRQAQQSEDDSLSLIVSGRTKTSVTVQWSKPSGASIYIVTLSGGSAFESQSFNSGDPNQYTFKGLRPDSSYSVQITAVGDGSESTSVSARTLSAVAATPTPPPTNTPVPPPSNTPVPPPPTNTPIPPPTNTPVPPPPTNTPIPPPTNTPVPPPPTNTPIPPPPTSTPIPPPPSNTPVPPPPTNTPIPPPPTNTPVPQVDEGLLAEIEAKIVRHRDETGRADLVAGFTAARAGLTGDISPEDALAAIESGWKNDLWRRIRKALKALKS